jgi:hypothetical protein
MAILTVGANAQWNATNPATWVAGHYFEIKVLARITGWSSSAIMSSDADTRVVAAAYSSNTATAVTNGNTLVFEDKEFDTHNAYNTSTGEYTVQVPGIYRVSAHAGTESVVGVIGTGFGLRAIQTGSASVTAQGHTDIADSTGTRGYYGSVSHLFNCRAGDVLKITMSENIGAVNTLNLTEYNKLSIERISGPAQIAASETVAARYSLTTSQTGITDKVIPFNSKYIDTHGAFNSSTGVFTAPVAGLYHISAAIYSSSLDGATPLSMSFRKNSSEVSQVFGYRPTDGTTTEGGVSGSDLISLLAGETLDVYVDGDASFTLSSGGTRTFVSIFKV